MKTNYILIDYENVQPKSLSILTGHTFKVIVFIGANQAKISTEFARALQSFGNNAEYIQIAGSGRNALDFHIAFTVGELSQSDPNAVFHIVSKDSGFDPLISYIEKKGITAHRVHEIADIPLLKPTGTKTLAEKLTAIVRNLVARGSSRPRKVKTLKNTINTMFQKSLSESQLTNLIQELDKQGLISIRGEHVNYNLPST